MRDAQQVEPLVPEMAELLAFERERPAPPADVQKRVLLGVMTAVNLSPIPPTPGTATDALGSSAASKIAYGTGLTATVAKTVVIFAVGAASGAGVHAYLSPAPTQAPAPVEAPAVVVPEPVVSTATPAPALAPAVTKARAPTPREHDFSKDADLAAERAILEQARLALVRGRHDDAAAALGSHKRQYATGRLVEEREALSILLLLGQGQTRNAGQGLERFRRAYPSSMFLPSIEQRVHALETPEGKPLPATPPMR